MHTNGTKTDFQNIYGYLLEYIYRQVVYMDFLQLVITLCWWMIHNVFGILSFLVFTSVTSQWANRMCVP